MRAGDIIRRGERLTAARSVWPPEMLAETIIRRVERLADPVRRDDMTALCARVALRREAG